MKKRLRQRLALLLIGICTFGCLTGYFVFNSPYWMTGIWTGLLTIGLFYLTLQLVVQSERKLTAFLQALSQSDFSVTFNESKTTDDYDLHYAFNRLTGMFVKLRSDKEAEHQLLDIVVEHAAVPLLCFDVDTREVFLINDAAKELFGIPFLQKVDALKRVDPALAEFVLTMDTNEKHSWQLKSNLRTVSLSISSRHIKFKGSMLKLVAFVDVSSELAAKEADSWRKLLRVLTHEISNSAIPLSTLSSYIYELITEVRNTNRALTEEEKDDIMESLRTIDRRSTSLKEFVQNFRSLNQIPEPMPERVNLRSIAMDTVALYSKDFERENIKVHLEELRDIEVIADINLTHQILINLVKNAMEAMSNMKEHKHLHFCSMKQGSHYGILEIRDTGVGIAPDQLEQIFIPFFSTKQGGSGIGLSMSQQIMNRQKGEISASSEVGIGSTFSLSFPS